MGENDTPPVDTNEEGKPVPYHRFAKVNEERATLGTKVQTLETELASTKASVAQEREAWNQDKSLMEAGILDAEGRDVARWLYGKLGEDKPKTIGAWLAAVKTEPPKALAPYLAPATPAQPPAPGQPPAAPAAPPAAPPRMPPPSGGGAQPPPAGPPVSVEQVRAIREEAQRTGDWSKWKALRPAVMDQMGKGR